MNGMEREKLIFELNEESLTHIIKEVCRLHQIPAGSFWVAVCHRPDHPDNKPYIGKKRSDRKEAIKDAIEHNRQYVGHHAGVIGQFD